MNADLAMQRALDRFHHVGFSGLREEEKTLAAIWCFESKVANGGFEHFFKSPEGDLAAHAPIAFQTIGARTLAEIAEQANAVFGTAGVPVDREERRAALRSLPAAARLVFDELETRYFESATDLEDRLEDYLAQAARHDG